MTSEVVQYLALNAGRNLALPQQWDPAEFHYPGNSQEFEDGSVVAVYDPISSTGAIYSRDPCPHWTIKQPCGREDFFDRLVPLFVESYRDYAAGIRYERDHPCRGV